MANVKQFFAVMRLSARSFPGRWESSLVIVVGLAIVTAVPLALLTMGDSLKESYLRAGAPDRVFVLSQAAHTLRDSHIPDLWVDPILHARGIRRAHGQALADPELAAGFHPRK